MTKSKETFLLIISICERAEALGIARDKRINHMMDIELAFDIYHVDLEAWLKANDENFAHDFLGIYENVDRNYKCFDLCFCPRFATV